MSVNQLTQFLGLLRLIKRSNPGNTPLNLVVSWTGVADPPTSTVLKIAAYVTEQAEATESFIAATQLSEEAKEGLMQTARSLKTAFQLQNLSGNAVHGFLPALDAAISQYAILISAAGLETPAGASDEKDNLVQELKAFLEHPEINNLDQAIRETLIKHINLLIVLINNFEAVGPEASMSAYNELVIRLSSAHKSSSKENKNVIEKIWPEVERWAGRIAIIDSAFTQGTHLITSVGTATKSLLPLLPHLPT